jgi:hypothetical protein
MGMEVPMRRTLVLISAAVFVFALAAPVSAGKPMEVSGTETFFLTPTCNPGAAFGGVDPADCKTAGPNVFMGLANPGFRDGTFEGTQFFDGKVNAKANGDFTFRGILTFEGTVEGCGTGTVVFFNEGAGNFVTGLTRNHQVALSGKGTLKVHANLDLIPSGANTNTITGTYHC